MKYINVLTTRKFLKLQPDYLQLITVEYPRRFGLIAHDMVSIKLLEDVITGHCKSELVSNPRNKRGKIGVPSFIRLFGLTKTQIAMSWQVQF